MPANDLFLVAMLAWGRILRKKIASRKILRKGELQNITYLGRRLPNNKRKYLDKNVISLSFKRVIVVE